MNKIAKSLAMIAFVAAIAVGATSSFFSDEEKSVGNTFTAGVVDIVVDGQNPWHMSTPYKLEDMKPSFTKYIKFTVRNLVNSNPINLWKHIKITDQSDGVITEPECEEGGGTWVWDNTNETGKCEDSYVPRNNLAAYIIYDMWVCDVTAGANLCTTELNTDKPTGDNWIPIIKEEQNVRLNWVNCNQAVC